MTKPSAPTDPTFFRDGYTRRTRAKSVPGLHGECNFEFRPTTIIERDRMQRLVDTQHPDVYNPAAFIMLAKHIVTWDICDHLGESVQVARENMAFLPPKLYDTLYFIVMGRIAGDLPDNATDEEADNWIKDLERGVGTAEADAVKNSTPG